MVDSARRSAPSVLIVPATVALCGWYYWYVLLVMMLVYAFNYINHQIINVLAAYHKADPRITGALLGHSLGAAFALFYGLSKVIAGRRFRSQRLRDHPGPRFSRRVRRGWQVADEWLTVVVARTSDFENATTAPLGLAGWPVAFIAVGALGMLGLFSLGPSIIGLGLGPYTVGFISNASKGLRTGIIAAICIVPVSLSALLFAARRVANPEEAVLARGDDEGAQ